MRKFVVATGVASYANIPDNLSHLPAALLLHSQEHKDFSSFKDKDVIVVGSGQSALERVSSRYSRAEVYRSCFDPKGVKNMMVHLS